MKFIATSQIDSLLQSALSKVAKTSSLPADKIRKVVTAMNQHISDYENPLICDQTANNIVAQLRSFAHAKRENNIQVSNQAEKTFETLTQKHTFPWNDVKGYFLEIFHKKANLVYRDWQIEGEKDIAFGMIPHRIKPNAKIAVIGDWGTGGRDAFSLLEQLLNYKDKPDVIVHLGDIYYACTQEEMKKNFLDPFDKAFKKAGYRVPVYSVPGNHDYYSGGQPFYDLLNEINTSLDPSYQQHASYFCLRTSDNSWQLLGADTGINDPGSIHHIPAPSIKPSELLWHRDKFQNFSGKTVFMTHHPLIEVAFPLSNSRNKDLQPFNMGMLKQFGPEFGNASRKAKMNLWLWGHDHYFVPFKTNIACAVPGVGDRIVPKSRLLGGSARETQRIAKKPHGRIQNKHLIERDAKGNLILPSHNNGYINHTWSLIDLGTKKISYFQTPAWDEDDEENSTTGLPSDQPLKFFEEDV